MKEETIAQNTDGMYACSSVPLHRDCWVPLCSGCLGESVMDSIRLQSSDSQPFCSVERGFHLGKERGKNCEVPVALNSLPGPYHGSRHYAACPLTTSGHIS